MDVNGVQIQGKWLKTSAQYEGFGYARFEDPNLSVLGNAIISFDEFGRSSIEMRPDALISGKPADVDTVSHTGKTNEEEAKYAEPQHIAQIENSRFIELVVPTQEGMFSIAQPECLRCYNTGSALKFTSNASKFDSYRPAAPKYWVLPLWNFVSGFGQMDSKLEDHPLRINNRRLIIFSFEGELGFIERLVDYERRVLDLAHDRAKRLLTAIMVGEVGPNSAEIGDLKEWFPFDYLGLLSLATGTQVSAPWVEFRGERGEFIRRIHLSLKAPCYSKGHTAIDEIFNRGIGGLLTRWPALPDLKGHGEPHFAKILDSLVESGDHSLTAEERLSSVLRGFGCLCETYGIKTIGSRDDSGSEQRTEMEGLVREALKLAESRLLNYIDTPKDSGIAKNSGKIKGCELIGELPRKIKGFSPQHNFAYGHAIVHLMNQFELNDARIIEDYYKAKSDKDQKIWGGVFLNCRAKAAHPRGVSPREDINRGGDVPAILKHLQDILLRITLKMLNYTGTYQPVVKLTNETCKTDWVKPNTLAKELGY